MSRISQFAGASGSLVVIASTLTLAPTAQAFDFQVSGQVNKALIGAENGEESDVGFVDDNASESRFEFKGSQDLAAGPTIGFDYEIGLADNDSSTFDINQSPTGDFVANRQAFAFIKGGFGRFALGKQNGAANSTSKVDLSGTTDLGGGTILEDYFGGLSFVDDDGGDTGFNFGEVYSSFDGLSRVNAVRYDTPSFGGLTFSASFDEGRAFEFAPRFKQTFANGIKFAAAADYVNSGQQEKVVSPTGVVSEDTQFNEFGGSASVLLPSGLNFTAMYKQRDFNDTGVDPQTYFGGVGYIIGEHHFQASYARTDDLAVDGSKGTAYGLAYRYDLLDSVNLYASYHLLRANDLDTGGGDAQNINTVFTGVRVKFF